MKLWKYSGALILWTAALHTLFGFAAGFDVWLAYVRQGSGMIGGLGQDPMRMALFWFLMTGFFWVPLGLLVRSYTRSLLRPPPAALGWWLFLLGVVGVLAIPASGFWLLFPQAAILLFASYLYVPHDIRVSRADDEPTSVVLEQLGRIDYTDTFAFELPPSAAPLSQARMARLIFGRAPRMVELLMRLRNWLVKPFGLKAEVSPGALRSFQVTSGRAPDHSIQAGDYVGFFEVFHVVDQGGPQSELVMGADDSHLNFRVSVVRQGRRYAFGTHVRKNNLLGRLYFLVVRPFHVLIVPAMIRSGLRSFFEQPAGSPVPGAPQPGGPIAQDTI